MPPKAKMPEAKFKNEAEWHSYLESLTHPQLKKVSTTLNKILRTEYRLDTKKTKTELLADVKRLYTVNNAEKLILTIREIDKNEMPKPPEPKPKKPTKQEKQSQDVSSFMSGMQSKAAEVEKTKDVKPDNLENLISDYIQDKKKIASKKPVFFECFEWLYLLDLAYILKNHNNDCAIISQSSSKKLYELNLYTNKNDTSYKDINDLKKIAYVYKLCKKNKKILVIPLHLDETHMNALFLNTLLNTAERYEPHGGITNHPKNIKITEQLKTFIDGINNLLPNEDKIKLVDIAESCPSKKGIQYYEITLENKNLKEEKTKEKFEFGNVLFKDPEGFCCAWSLLMIDLRLKFPDKSIGEINKIMTDKLIVNPIELIYFIRGFVSFTIYEVEKLINKVCNIHKELKPSFLWKLLTKKNKTYEEFKLINDASEYKNTINNIILDDLWKKYLMLH